ncbi:hypothetical protein F0562_017755 [Nyssa sinensis]|uniref:Protein kinase domain-containing protein n=1 Tax=Nyssa sinensis TaxID=561372 RepID=A0A5J4ZIX9_9ASTE|nr:hypothetical protein F0562_017755 [Nyssa sinensis]
MEKPRSFQTVTEKWRKGETKRETGTPETTYRDTVTVHVFLFLFSIMAALFVIERCGDAAEGRTCKEYPVREYFGFVVRNCVWMGSMMYMGGHGFCNSRKETNNSRNVSAARKEAAEEATAIDDETLNRLYFRWSRIQVRLTGTLPSLLITIAVRMEKKIKVSDFGLSALAKSKHQDGLLHTTCGTPAYVALEVNHRKGYEESKADIWSCEVILYVLLVDKSAPTRAACCERERAFVCGSTING